MGKRAAIRWANDTLKKPFVILDTETTGLRDGEIIQISIINHLGETLIDSLVKNTLPVPYDAYQVHGIDDTMLKTAPEWPQVLETVIPYIKGQKVIIYNADYDVRMLGQTCVRNGLDGILWDRFAKWECAMEVYAMFYGDWNPYHQSYRWQKLTTACEHLGIDQRAIVAPAHSALGDCLRTLAVIKAMAVAQASDDDE